MKTTLIAQGGANGTTLSAALKDITGVHAFDRLDVAVAYATRQGLKALEQALGGFPSQSRWVVGLDDAITQPEALEDLMKLNGAALRVASLAPQRRFHPKIYRLWSSVNPTLCVLGLGSGSMTLNGFRYNGEASVLLLAQNVAEVNSLRDMWTEMWALGNHTTEAALTAYRAKYIQAKKARIKIVDLGVAPPEPEVDILVDEWSAFNGDPATAQVAWTEAATPSAGGRDVEFPRAMMPFFALVNSPTTRSFRTTNGSLFRLTFTMRANNLMWRLLFSKEAITAGIGRESLRPLDGSTTRSDVAIIFSRSADPMTYDISMVVIGSPKHQQLIERSRAVNGLHSTRNPGGRNFGFY